MGAADQLSLNLLHQLPESAYGKTTPFDGYIVLAGGSRVEINKLITLHFRPGSLTGHHDFLKRDVADHALLGLDLENGLTLDFITSNVGMRMRGFV